MFILAYWTPPFACSLKSESGLISQTRLAIPLACIVPLPLAGFASSFKRLVPISRGSPLLYWCLVHWLGTIAYCVGAVSTRYRINRATKYESKISFCHTLRLLCLLLVSSTSPWRFGQLRFITICVCESTPKSMASDLWTGIDLPLYCPSIPLPRCCRCIYGSITLHLRCVGR